MHNALLCLRVCFSAPPMLRVASLSCILFVRSISCSMNEVSQHDHLEILERQRYRFALQLKLQTDRLRYQSEQEAAKDRDTNRRVVPLNNNYTDGGPQDLPSARGERPERD